MKLISLTNKYKINTYNKQKPYDKSFCDLYNNDSRNYNKAKINIATRYFDVIDPYSLDRDGCLIDQECVIFTSNEGDKLLIDDKGEIKIKRDGKIIAIGNSDGFMLLDNL